MARTSGRAGRTHLAPEVSGRRELLRELAAALRTLLYDPRSPAGTAAAELLLMACRDRGGRIAIHRARCAAPDKRLPWLRLVVDRLALAAEDERTALRRVLTGGALRADRLAPLPGERGDDPEP